MYYKIVKGRLESDLEAEVSKHIQEGWYCVGSPLLGAHMCRQAMERDPRTVEEHYENSID